MKFQRVVLLALSVSALLTFVFPSNVIASPGTRGSLQVAQLGTLGNRTVRLNSAPNSNGYWSSVAPSYVSSASLTATVAPTVVAWPSITVGKCVYSQPSDWPHISSNGLDASVHGWWTTTTSSYCSTTAKVTAYLQAVWCDWFGCSWVTVAVGPGAVVYPGGGAGFRDTARHACADFTTPVAYRGGTDVDLTGVNDPAGISWGPPRDGVNALLCAPS